MCDQQEENQQEETAEHALFQCLSHPQTVEVRGLLWADMAHLGLLIPRWPMSNVRSARWLPFGRLGVLVEEDEGSTDDDYTNTLRVYLFGGCQSDYPIFSKCIAKSLQYGSPEE